MRVRCVFLAAALVVAQRSAVQAEPGDVNIHMPSYQPKKDDDYVCTAAKIENDAYVVGYSPTAHADRVHHMLLYGCSEPRGAVGEAWPCLHGGLCVGGQKILFAWARNAPSFEVPPDVGFPLGNIAGFSHLVLQVHYATPLDGSVWDFTGLTLHTVPQPPPFLAAVYLFIGMMYDVPADTPTFFMNMSCPYNEDTEFTPFAFRTHTHGLGTLVSAAKQDPEQHWSLIGKRNPQWPQLFQKIPEGERLTIRKGDSMAAQCRFNSSSREHATHIGATGHDEMCNFYMMHYWKSSEKAPFGGSGSCAMDNLQAFAGSEGYPATVSELLPPRPAEEAHAKQSGVTFGRFRRQWDGAIPTRRRGDAYPDYGYGPVRGGAEGRSWSEGAGEDPPAEERLPLSSSPSRVFHVDHKVETARGRTAAVAKAPAPGTKKRVKELASWTTIGGITLGQVAGLAVAASGNLLVFHRGDVVWGPGSYDFDNVLRERKAVSVDPVLEINPTNGGLVRSFGKNSFYMPHGIAGDSKGNVWLTDVGLHQVFKYSADGQLLSSLGEAFKPGSDSSHFCKPTGVAVSSKGIAYISDGYCNNRIVVFSADGLYLREFGTRSKDISPPLGTFILPHDITIHEAVDHIHVADRQNGRVQMMFTNGTAIKELKPPSAFNNVYSTDFCSHDGMVFVLPGERGVDGSDIRAFSMSTETAEVAYSFAPASKVFSRPHVIRASADCSAVFVGEIDGQGGRIWSFAVERDSAPVSPAAAAASAASQKRVEAAAKGGAAPPAPIPALPLPRRSGGLGLWATVTILVLVSVFLCTSVFICLRCRAASGKRRAMNLQSVGLSSGLFSDSSRNYKGFQRLRTEDIDAMDDITDSDEDDLYSAPRSKP